MSVPSVCRTVLVKAPELAPAVPAVLKKGTACKTETAGGILPETAELP